MEILFLRTFTRITHYLIWNRRLFIEMLHWCVAALLLGGVAGFLLRVAL